MTATFTLLFTTMLIFTEVSGMFRSLPGYGRLAVYVVRFCDHLMWQKMMHVPRSKSWTMHLPVSAAVDSPEQSPFVLWGFFGFQSAQICDVTLGITLSSGTL